MTEASVPPDEARRLAAVRRYDVLDTPPDGAFERITALAARLLRVPIAIVSIVDTDRIWFKSHHGLDVDQIDRVPGLCASAILQTEPWLVEDAHLDPRALTNPLVAGAFGLRFYAGVPLTTSDGYNLGTVCVIDREPRVASKEDVATLQDLASMVMDQLELRLAVRRTPGLEQQIEAEKRFRAAFYQAATGNLLTTLDGRFLQVNPSLCQMLGYSETELLGKSMPDITLPADVEESGRRLERLARNESAVERLQKRYLHKRGSIVWANVSLVLLRDDRGAPQHLMVQIQDITEQKHLEDSLRESEERYRQMFEQNRSIQLLIDTRTFDVVHANPAACTFYGYSLPVLRHMNMRDINGLTSSQNADTVNELREHQALPVMLRSHRLATGQVRTVEIHASLLMVQGRELSYSIIHDVTERERVQEALRKSEHRFSSLVESSPDAILLTDQRATILAANLAAAKMYGYESPGELQGLDALAMTAPHGRERLHSTLMESARSTQRPAETVDYEQSRRDGGVFPVETRAVVIPEMGGQAESILLSVRDVSARREADLAARRLAAIVEAASDAVIGMTPDGIITSWNPGAENLYGYSAEESIGRSASMLVPADRMRERVTFEERLQRDKSVKHFHTVRVRKGGQRFDVSISVSPILDQMGVTTAYAVTAYDVTELKAFEARLKHQILHDTLTHLPNRILLNDRLEQAILAANRGATSMALLLLDLDRFKEVNDTLGHEAGDALIREVASRLLATLRQSDTAARLGGDEFAIILPAVEEQRAHLIAGKIQTALRRAFILEGHRVDIDASIGIALYPTHGTDASTLLRRADVAMYAAKRSGVGHCTYAPDQDLHSPLRLGLFADLRYAIEREQLVLHYQPKLDIRTGSVEQAEALVAWQHPELGLIPAGEFISIAEETGLIGSLTRWVLTTALEQCAAWRSIGLNMSIAANLSALTLNDSHLPEIVATLLRCNAVDASALTLEITEGSLMSDPEGALTILDHLHDMGVKISVDDFGTGYSSLSYLKQMPLDEIKIDRSFVLGMSRNGTVIVRSVIDLGRNLGLVVTAEGVEDQETLNMLGRMGCDMAQGFYLSRPLLALDFTAWLQARSSDAVSAPTNQNLVLVVDDNPVYGELLHVLLMDAGYEVTTVRDAHEALEALHVMTPNLVLVDVRLPGVSGIELARQIRLRHELRETTIIAMTGSPREDEAQYALSIGCDVYTRTPSTNGDVVQLIGAHMNMSLPPQQRGSRTTMRTLE